VKRERIKRELLYPVVCTQLDVYLSQSVYLKDVEHLWRDKMKNVTFHWDEPVEYQVKFLSEMKEDAHLWGVWWGYSDSYAGVYCLRGHPLNLPYYVGTVKERLAELKEQK
jgi:hypothetical protein